MKKNNSLSVEEINMLAEQAVHAGQAGRDQEAIRLWTQVVIAEPNHVPALKSPMRASPRFARRSLQTSHSPAHVRASSIRAAKFQTTE